jgi:hypothetical protein
MHVYMHVCRVFMWFKNSYTLHVLNILGSHDSNSLMCGLVQCWALRTCCIPCRSHSTGFFLMRSSDVGTRVRMWHGCRGVCVCVLVFVVV